MTTATEPFAALGKAHLDAAARLAAIAADSTEKLFDLQVRAAKATLAEVARTAKTLGEAKNVADLPAWAGAQPMADKATAYAGRVYDIAAEARAGIVAAMEAESTELNKQWAAAFDAAFKATPGAEFLAPAWKSTVATANAFMEGLSRAGKDLAAMTDASVATVSTVTPIRKKAA